MTRTALLVGSTGLIGSQLLTLLLQDNYYERVIALSRTALPSHAKLTVIQTDLAELSRHKEWLKANDVFCCLGSTMRKAKSKEAFIKIDFDYPLAVARYAREQGATQYLLVSALGANKGSSIFYNRVKGDVEEAISSLGFETVHIFRPSLLAGARKEQRSGEEAAKVFYKIFGFLIPARYKAIDSTKVAKAMVAFAGQANQGVFIHESEVLQKY